MPQSASSEHLYALATSESSTRSRRRFSSAQTVVLEQLFHTNPNPSLKEREALARCLDPEMELRPVTIWFQNKRQTQRRATTRRAHTLEAITNTATTNCKTLPSYKSRASSTSTPASASRRPSLDRVASRSELRAPAPRTPVRRHNPHAPLWANMASSPIGPPTSPVARDYVEFGASQRTRTLEWACARCRLSGKDDKGVPRLLEDAGEETDVEVEEAITPPSSCDSSWTMNTGVKPTVPTEGEPDEDMMNAALALCVMRG
ncbi:homeodomain transcription factor [Mycena belliarum]|uniref:Homeodomain transcription factor n=1 Tax=Mycena belliarum TaxID=1033014 RepID=A0AAD6Y1U2_9AGAR|nr:homeodomain transcription factor [Mycena belliae]